MKSFFLILFLGSFSLASVDCPSSYPNGSTLTYSSGAMNYPNGSTLRYSTGAMNYPSGSTLRYTTGAMNYENGSTLMYSTGAMNYPNGSTLRYSTGALNDPSGSTNHTGVVSLSTSFGSGKMRIVARANSANFQTTIPYGNGVMIVDFDDKGNVACTVEEADGPSEFRVDGFKGSAYVTVKAGQNVNAVKRAVQKALDGE